VQNLRKGSAKAKIYFMPSFLQFRQRVVQIKKYNYFCTRFIFFSAKFMHFLKSSSETLLF